MKVEYNVLILSSANLDYDGRLRDLLKLFNKIGKIHLINTGGSCENATSHYIAREGVFFFFDALKYFFKVKKYKIDILVFDNRKPTLLLSFAKNILSPKFFIQDSRELYLPNEVHKFYSKIGCFFEKRSIQRADLLIVANKERALFMKQYYKLKNKIVVLDNLRQLSFKYQLDDDFINKIDRMITKHKYFIVSTAGCDISRRTDILVKSVKHINEDVGLILVGNSSISEKNQIKQIKKNENLNNIYLLDRLNQTELKYLISRCHVGIVSYHQNDFNNKYCASGKIFEFLFEGLPVVTTTNPPLVNVCQKWNVGISDDNFADGVSKILIDYDLYYKNVKSFSNENNPDTYISKIADKVKKFLNTIVKEKNEENIDCIWD